ncbi:MAG TPA: type II/IV secretion system protein [Firmicutes bacterium]|nr:type II/IV secretion system protein [Candidatus Fermentithermobacillaceae bacterium]
MNELEKIGTLLVNDKLVDPDTLQKAVEAQRQSGGKLGEILIKMGALSAHKFYEALAKQLGVPFCDLRNVTPDPEVLKLLSVADARRLRAIPVAIRGDILDVAVENPSDLGILEAIRTKTGLKVSPMLAIPEDIDDAIQRFYELPSNVERAAFRLTRLRNLQQRVRTDETAPSPSSPRPLRLEDEPIINVVDNMIKEAARRGASDIHVEPFSDKSKIRFRIDGVLEQAGAPPRTLHDAIVTRLKVLGGMDIAEKRLPQDGRFSTSIDGRPYDLRVSTLPTIFGEKVVIRLLEQSTDYTSLEALGLSSGVLQRFKKVLSLPYGMIVVAGPTGSGKSTTLAAALREINAPGKNIVTVEDPVEYVIPGVNHTQVNIKSGLSFATVVRHVLRQDPDIIMIGEIRDVETAEIAFRAALTGHLVLTTIHANDALSVLMRFEEMGVNKYMALSSIVALFSQRLVRTLCPWCKKSWSPPDEVLDEILRAAGVSREEARVRMYSAKACPTCFHKGYRGRTAISEIIVVDEEFRRRFMASEDPKSDPFLNPAKRHQGLLADGARKVLEGITTWEEVQRVFSGDESY